jgi:hypothetical protein
MSAFKEVEWNSTVVVVAVCCISVGLPEMFGKKDSEMLVHTLFTEGGRGGREHRVRKGGR